MLIDRIIKVLEHLPNAEHGKFFLSHLRKAEVILADNVADYLFRQNSQEYWDIETDFPNVAPPFPTMFVEYHPPEYIVSNVFGTKKQERICKTLGSLLLSQEIDQGFQELAGSPPLDFLITLLSTCHLGKTSPQEQLETYEKSKLLIKRFGASEGMMTSSQKAELEGVKQKMLGQWSDYITPLNLKWVIIQYNFIEGLDGGIFPPQAAYQLMVRNDGRPHLPDGKVGVMIMSEALAKRAALDEKLMKEVTQTSSLDVPLLTLCFMHCKNTTLRTIQPPAKLNKARLKRGNSSLAVYKILDIEPMKKILEDQGGQQHTGLKKALHICRGHFKDYSVGKGLFGRGRGLYWWDMHLRGTPEVGAVVKDYRVSPEKVSLGVKKW